MRHTLSVLTAMLIAAGSAMAEDSRTKVKGFYLGMAAQDVLNLKLPELDVKTEPNQIRLFPKEKDPFRIDCAKFEIDQSVVKVMTFTKCMFNANDLTDEQFAAALIENYKLPRLSCEPYTYMGYNANFKMTQLIGRKCTGFTKPGELVTIDGNEIKFELRDKKPTFN